MICFKIIIHLTRFHVRSWHHYDYFTYSLPTLLKDLRTIIVSCTQKDIKFFKKEIRFSSVTVFCSFVNLAISNFGSESLIFLLLQELAKFTNEQNSVRTHGQPSGQLFHKNGNSTNQTELKVK